MIDGINGLSHSNRAGAAYRLEKRHVLQGICLNVPAFVCMAHVIKVYKHIGIQRL